MTGLVLKLAPRERIVINGAVIENGDRRSKLSVMTPGTHVLRLRDAIHPDEANTPVRRACYMAQLLLTGDAAPAEMKTPLLKNIETLSQALTDTDSHAHLGTATRAFLEGDHYRCLKSLRALLPREDRLLAVASK